ncbi:MAG: ABC transporter permease, partial [Armatimonadetes bacterium]|nr:ABC transporter permease [Armatimonadota bacterium]
MTNPILDREIRTRWRDGRAFILVLVVTAGLALLFAGIYGENASDVAQSGSSAQWSILGHSLFSTLAWVQTLSWLLISPALTSSVIATERERGWFDSLLLSPLLPRQIVAGKWLGALAYAATLYAITLPFSALTFLLGGVSPLEWWLVLALHGLCACCGASIGLAASAWSFRASAALRSAYGLIVVWLMGSLGGALVAGETPFLVGAIFTRFFLSPTPFGMWLGRTNPVLRALEITSASPTQYWPFCFAVLGAATLFFLAIAVYCARQPLAEAPFIQRKKKPSAKTPSTHAKIPLVTRLRFANPVLDREVRAKFVMRTPPLGVIVAEAILGVLVAYFYVRTFLWALFEPQYRPIIWWGLVFTGLIVTMMACATMGANALSRERERGTWDGVRLSLLGPAEIMRGKVWSSLLTCALFSLAIWPLLLPCVSWNTWNRTSSSVIALLQVMACLGVWGATAWSYTLIGMWIGRTQGRSARAVGQTVGFLAAFVLLSPVLFSTAIVSTSGERMVEWILVATHPLIAVAMAVN